MVSRVASRAFGGRGGAVAAAALTALAVGLTSTALGAPVESQVEFLGTDTVGPGNTLVIYGVVTSDRRQCLSGRKVKAIAVTPTGDVPIDTGRSGVGGGWQARDTAGALEGADALKLTLLKKTVKQGKKTLKCSGETVQLS